MACRKLGRYRRLFLLSNCLGEVFGVASAVDEDRVMEFLIKVVGDAAAGMCALSVAIGDRLGLYTAMAGAGPVTSEELAARTGLVERYVREWLAAQVVSDYVEFDPTNATYNLPDERAAVLADPEAPTYAAGGFLFLNAIFDTEDRLVEAFRTGDGVGWDEHRPQLFSATAKFFRPGYMANIVDGWLPALDGVVDKLRVGVDVADVGCGFGHSTMIMAEAFPASRFVGFDYHGPSIEAARKAAAETGIRDRVRFEVASASEFPGSGYDLITAYDCVHDMGDPAAVARRARGALTDDGTFMMVEPNASGRLEENLNNPIARLILGASLAICLPSAIAQHGPYALGNHAGEDAMREIVTNAGFTRWRRAAETPVNLIYEARP